MIGRYADSGITNLDRDEIAVAGAGDSDFPALRVTDRVRNEIAEQATQQLGIGVHAFGRSLDDELETFLRCLRLEVRPQPLENLVDRAGRWIRRHAAAVELADVEHGREQCRHRIERELLPLEQAEHGGIPAGLALCCAVQQVQRLERLAQVVARGREEPALLSVLGHELVFLVAPERGVANRRDDEQAFVRGDGAQADLDRKFVAVLMAAVERAAGTHGARLRMRGEALTVAGMRVL